MLPCFCQAELDATITTLKEKQALLKQVEEQIRALQEEYDKGVNEKESLGKRLIAHSRQERSDFQKRGRVFRVRS